MTAHPVDLFVVGAGFGGLATALEAARRGARVVLAETLSYPGGCASTFTRGGMRFESGATLFSGLAPDQLFGRWIDRYGLDVEIDWLDPVVELRAPDLELAVPRERADLVRALQDLPGAPRAALGRFFEHQLAVADLLWDLLDRPELLPPLGPRSLLVHAARLPRYLPLLRWLGRPLVAVLRAHGLEGFAPLRTYLEGLCQITVQCGVEEAEASFALGTMDYYWRGTGHVRGGIGELAAGLLRAIEAEGGEVHLACRVRRLERGARGWRVHTRRGTFEARHVAANLLPAALRELVPGERLPRSLARMERQVRSGWGACMLYRVARVPRGWPPGPAHLDLVDDPRHPFTLGNHVFCSISGEADGGRAPAGRRTLTVSTHVPMDRYLALDGEARGAFVAAIQERMRRTLALRAPEWEAGVELELPASPRTFERFTGRPLGYVGGIPRRAGLHHYLPTSGRALLPGLHLVGDSVFPGQSTLATALGGVNLARSLSLPAGRRPGRRAGLGPTAGCLRSPDPGH